MGHKSRAEQADQLTWSLKKGIHGLVFQLTFDVAFDFPVEKEEGNCHDGNDVDKSQAGSFKTIWPENTFFTIIAIEFQILA